ncbi:LIC12015 family putative lipoprotein [Leptospira sp. GIMC2001]|uniref:LIC12015 family putative lipoprotein n=1 Tax=Leptospira sp. GIMC2001 TaxID=1513297 RepID=UPI0023494CF3|nr:hypothetical protein [Leptospira sp. GIMC2001]WCL48022.1 hypothetical protein O4O04_11910 [Leptospira sp. GIMC2001]
MLNQKTIKLKYIIPLSITLMVMVNCTLDSDALAVYEGGTVTRKELRDFYEIRGVKLDEKNSSIQAQSNLLEQIALQKIVYNEHTSSGKISKEFMDNLVSLTKGQMLVALYKKDFESKTIKKTPMELMTMQMVVLKDPDNSKDALASEILTKLNSTSSSKELNKLVTEYTEDESRKSVAGIIEPFCLNCGPNPFEDVLSDALNANDDNFHLKRAGEIIYIIKIVNIRKINQSVVNQYLSEKFEEMSKTANEYAESTEDEAAKQSARYYSDGDPVERGQSMGEHISRQFKTQLWQTELERIRTESSIKVDDPPMLKQASELKLSEFPPTRILASISETENITVGDFAKDFSELSKIIGNNGQSPKEQEMFDMLNFFYNIYLSSLYLEQDPKSKSILETEIYKDSIQYLKYSLVWALFMKDIASEKIVVSDQEIRETYEAGKLFAYSEPDKNNPQKRIPRPLGLVKNQIQNDLENAKRKGIFDGKINTLKADYKLKIDSESLRNGKI